MALILPPFMYYHYNRIMHDHFIFYANEVLNIPRSEKTTYTGLFEKSWLFEHTDIAFFDALAKKEERQRKIMNYQAYFWYKCPEISNNLIYTVLWLAAYTALLAIDLVIFMPFSVCRDLYRGAYTLNDIPLLGPLFGLISDLLSFTKIHADESIPAKRYGFIQKTLLVPYVLLKTKLLRTLMRVLYSVTDKPLFKEENSNGDMEFICSIKSPAKTAWNLTIIAIMTLITTAIGTLITPVVTAIELVIAISRRLVVWLHHLTNLGVEKDDQGKYIDNRLVVPLLYRYHYTNEKATKAGIRLAKNFVKYIINTALVMPLNLACYLIRLLPLLPNNRAVTQQKISFGSSNQHFHRKGSNVASLYDDSFDSLGIVPTNVYITYGSANGFQDLIQVNSHIRNDTWTRTLRGIVAAPFVLAFRILGDHAEYREWVDRVAPKPAQTAPVSGGDAPHAAHHMPHRSRRTEAADSKATTATQASPTPRKDFVKRFFLKYVAPISGLPLLYSLIKRVYKACANAVIPAVIPKAPEAASTTYARSLDGSLEQEKSETAPQKPKKRFSLSLSRLFRNLGRLFIPFASCDQLPRSTFEPMRRENTPDSQHPLHGESNQHGLTQGTTRRYALPRVHGQYPVQPYDDLTGHGQYPQSSAPYDAQYDDSPGHDQYSAPYGGPTDPGQYSQPFASYSTQYGAPSGHAQDHAPHGRRRALGTHEQRRARLEVSAHGADGDDGRRSEVGVRQY